VESQRFSEFFYEQKEALEKPGPGTYDLPLSWVAPTAIKDFGSEELGRTDLEKPLSFKDREALLHPGPGEYKRFQSAFALREHTSSYVSVRQRTSAYVAVLGEYKLFKSAFRSA
jgi:hypothetical protein